MSIAIAKFLAGILVCNTLTDLLQEKSFGNIHDNENKKIERVIDAIILFSLIQSIVNVIVSIATTYRHSFHLKKGMELYFGVSAGFQITSMLLSTLSLQYISYPIKIIGKSCKMLPVMIIGASFDGKKYTVLQYICSIFVSTGIIIFYLGKKNTSENKTSIIGAFMISTSVLLDGFNSSVQTRVRNNHKDISGSHLMLYTNLWKVLILTCGFFSWGSVTWNGFSDIKNIEFDFTRGLIILITSIGQFFVFTITGRYGSMVTAIVTSVRKFVSIILSIIVFRHKITTCQWLGILIVFTGIILEYKTRHVNKSLENKSDQNDNV